MTANTKKLNLSALKSNSNGETTASTSVSEQKISLGATVSTSKQNIATPIAKPVATPHSPEAVKAVEGNSHQTPAALWTDKNIPKEEKIVTPVKKVEEEPWKTLISLSSIKSAVPAKPKVPIETSSKDSPEHTELLEKNVANIATQNQTTNTQEEKSEVNTTPWDATEESKNISLPSNSTDTKDLEAAITPKIAPLDTKLVEEETEKLKEQIQSDIQWKEKKKAKKDIEIDDNLFENYVPKYGKEHKEKESQETSVDTHTRKRFRGVLRSKKKKIILITMLLCVFGLSAGWFVYFNNTDGENSIKANIIENSIDETKQNVSKIIEEVEEIPITDEMIDTEDKEPEETQETQNDIWNNKENTKVKNYLLDNYYK